MNLILPYSLALRVLEHSDLSTEVFDVEENNYVELHINFLNKTCVIKKTDRKPTPEDITFASMLVDTD